MPSKLLLILTILIGLILPESAVHNDMHDTAQHLHINGASISIFWLIPFMGILLSIAIFPLFLPNYWHHNYGKVSLFWGSLFIVLFTWKFGFHISAFYLIEVYLKEFIPFIVILIALFTVSGGVLISGNMQGTPRFNTCILIIGTILASWMGTTGASMLLIRPLIRANVSRKNKTHIFVFFIFLVSNIGGALTPLGDPPLFLGFLKGVDFFWTTTNLFLPLIYISIPLILLFFVTDSYFYSKETKTLTNENFSFKIDGKRNLFLIIFIIVSVIISGVWKADAAIEGNWFIEYGNECIMTYGNFLQVSALLLITFISLKITPLSIRLKNDFSWEPVKEVTKLFATIFITMVPAISMLKAGSNGPLNKIITLLTNSNGDSINFMYFWVTGILSSFLDNAPTYLVFFETAGGNAGDLMTDNAETLIAISAGAVFMGAMSYIGNAPNFMVKSIAEQNKIKMPSFFGYMIWSVALLVPVLIIFSLLYFTD
jgi:Na+/H+ antiporter NhaD/arsenite permease-like protein